MALLAEFIGRVTSGTICNAMWPGASVVVSPLGYTAEHISSMSFLECSAFVMMHVAVQNSSVFFLKVPCCSDAFGSSCNTSLFSNFHSSVESGGSRHLISRCRKSKLINSMMDPLSHPAGIGFSSWMGGRSTLHSVYLVFNCSVRAVKLLRILDEEFFPYRVV